VTALHADGRGPPSNPLTEVFDLRTSAESSFSSGDYLRSFQLYSQALSKAEDHLGPLDLTVADLRFRLAAVASETGDFEKASALCKQSELVQQRLLASGSPDFAKGLTDCSTVLLRLGSYEDAEKGYRQALSIFTTVYGIEHHFTIAAMENLGNVLDYQGKFQESLDVLLKSRDLKIRIFGPNSLDVARSLNNIGATLASLDRLSESNAFYRGSLQLKELHLGPDHPGIAGTIDNLSWNLASQGKLKAALTYCLRARALLSRAFGPNHPRLAWNTGSHARILGFQGKTEKSIVEFERSLRFYSLTGGPPDREVVQAYCNVLKERGEASDVQRVKQLQAGP
jgi:tetratricopeptide (TPR) repeat protein